MQHWFALQALRTSSGYLRGVSASRRNPHHREPWTSHAEPKTASAVRSLSFVEARLSYTLPRVASGGKEGHQFWTPPAGRCFL